MNRVGCIVVAIFAATGCSAPDVCKGIKGACVALDVEGRGISAIDQLSVDVAGTVSGGPTTTPNSPVRTALPLDIAVSFGMGIGGSEHIHVVGLLAGQEVGEGAVDVVLVNGQHQRVPIELESAAGKDMESTEASPDDLAVDGGEDLAEGLIVEITTPGSTIYTNGSVSVQVSVTGGTPDSVTLTRDGSLLATLSAPYAYSWDTTVETEGPHSIVARATGGGAVFLSDPKMVVVDRTAPTVTSRIPAPGATEFEVEQPITVVFSEPMLLGSIGDTNIVATTGGGASVSKSLALSPDGKTLTIGLTSQLATLPTTLTIGLGQISDLAGNLVVPPASAWTWTVPVWGKLGAPLNAFANRDVDGVTGLDVSVAVDGMRRPIVGWFESDGSIESAYVQRWDGVGAWSSLGAALNPVAGQSVLRPPVIAVDSMSRPVLALLEYDGTHTNAYVERWDGSAWQPLGGALNAVAGQNVADTPCIAIDSGDRPVIGFIESDGSRPNVYVQRWNGASWDSLGGALNAVGGQGVNSYPSIAADGTGRPVVAWQESDGTHQNIYVLKWDGISGWPLLGSAINAVANQTVGFVPVVRIDSSGRAVVSFYESDGVNDNVYVFRWDGSTTWVPLGGAQNGATGSVGQPALAVDNSARPLLAWAQSGVYVRRWDGISSWASLGGVVNGVAGQIPSIRAALTVDVLNKPVLGFVESDGMYKNVYVMRMNQ